MDDEFYNKTKEYLDQIHENTDAGRFLDAISILNDGIAYLDNYNQKKDIDPQWKLYYFDNYRNNWKIFKYVLETRNDLETFKKEVQGKMG
ncbi:hypothetical protein [Nitrosopumilus sp. S4]